MRSQRWLVRVSAAAAVGGGHVARSRLVARALAETSAVELDLVGDDGRWQRAMRDEPFRLASRGNASKYDGTLLDLKPLDGAAIAQARPGCGLLAVYDDDLALPPGVDLVINPAVHLSGTASEGTAALFGPAFASVAPTFAALATRTVAAQSREILIGFGLVDSLNATGLVLESLASLRERGLSFRAVVLLGSRAPHRGRIEQAVAAISWARLTIDCDDVPALLAVADLAIGAPGVSLLERLAAGVATATLAQNRAQRPLLEGAAASGATVDLGLLGETSAAVVAERLAAVLADKEGRARLAAVGRRLVDGQGARRIADELLHRAAHQPAVAAAAP